MPQVPEYSAAESLQSSEIFAHICLFLSYLDLVRLSRLSRWHHYIIRGEAPKTTADRPPKKPAPKEGSHSGNDSVVDKSRAESRRKAWENDHDALWKLLCQREGIDVAFSALSDEGTGIRPSTPSRPRDLYEEKCSAHLILELASPNVREDFYLCQNINEVFQHLQQEFACDDRLAIQQFCRLGLDVLLYVGFKGKLVSVQPLYDHIKLFIGENTMLTSRYLGGIRRRKRRSRRKSSARARALTERVPPSCEASSAPHHSAVSGTSPEISSPDLTSPDVNSPHVTSPDGRSPLESGRIPIDSGRNPLDSCPIPQQTPRERFISESASDLDSSDSVESSISFELRSDGSDDDEGSQRNEREEGADGSNESEESESGEDRRVVLTRGLAGGPQWRRPPAASRRRSEHMDRMEGDDAHVPAPAERLCLCRTPCLHTEEGGGEAGGEEAGGGKAGGEEAGKDEKDETRGEACQRLSSNCRHSRATQVHFRRLRTFFRESRNCRYEIVQWERVRPEKDGKRTLGNVIECPASLYFDMTLMPIKISFSLLGSHTVRRLFHPASVPLRWGPELRHKDQANRGMVGKDEEKSVVVSFPSRLICDVRKTKRSASRGASPLHPCLPTPSVISYPMESSALPNKNDRMSLYAYVERSNRPGSTSRLISRRNGIFPGDSQAPNSPGLFPERGYQLVTSIEADAASHPPAHSFSLLPPPHTNYMPLILSSPPDLLSGSSSRASPAAAAAQSADCGGSAAADRSARTLGGRASVLKRQLERSSGSSNRSVIRGRVQFGLFGHGGLHKHRARRRPPRVEGKLISLKHGRNRFLPNSAESPYTRPVNHAPSVASRGPEAQIADDTGLDNSDLMPVLYL